MIKLYECGICSGLHPWEWDGDCRDNDNRYGDINDFCKRNKTREFDKNGFQQIEILSMDERIEKDNESMKRTWALEDADNIIQGCERMMEKLNTIKHGARSSKEWLETSIQHGIERDINASITQINDLFGSYHDII